MTCRWIGRLVAGVLLGVIAGSGCSSEAPSSASTNAMHKTSNFSAAELNAPLSAKAKASGAQVAAPPMR